MHRVAHHSPPGRASPRSLTRPAFVCPRSARVVEIQSCWRGYLGRLRGKLAREGRDKLLRQVGARGVKARGISRSDPMAPMQAVDYITPSTSWPSTSPQLYFDAKATAIQRHWRGFWSRHSRFDFYARQRYLREVREKNEAVRAEMEVEAQRTLAVQREVRALKGGGGIRVGHGGHTGERAQVCVCMWRGG